MARAPLRAANAQALAVVLGERAAYGDPSAAGESRGAWERAHALAPQDADALLQDADQQIRLGDAPLALALARRAGAVYPRDGPTLFRLSGAEGFAGDSSAAFRTLQAAVASEWRGNEGLRRNAAAVLDSVRHAARSR